MPRLTCFLSCIIDVCHIRKYSPFLETFLAHSDRWHSSVHQAEAVGSDRFIQHVVLKHDYKIKLQVILIHLSTNNTATAWPDP